MNNREREFKSEGCHIAIALLRKKDNDRRNRELCFRQIIRDEKSDLNVLKERVKNIPGNWRIYKTVNKRLYAPALILMMQILVDPREAKKFEYRLDSLWKNCLLQKKCKGERNFLIDVDTNEIPEKLNSLLESGKIEVDEKIKTPNGWHIICSELDTRLLQNIEDVEVKRDDVKFVERFTIELSDSEYFDRVLELKDEYKRLIESRDNGATDFEEQYIKQKHKNLLDERDMCLDQLRDSLNKLGNPSDPSLAAVFAANIEAKIENLEKIV